VTCLCDWKEKADAFCAAAVPGRPYSVHHLDWALQPLLAHVVSLISRPRLAKKLSLPFGGCSFRDSGSPLFLSMVETVSKVAPTARVIRVRRLSRRRVDARRDGPTRGVALARTTLREKHGVPEAQAAQTVRLSRVVSLLLSLALRLSLPATVCPSVHLPSAPVVILRAVTIPNFVLLVIAKRSYLWATY
jgi:hypothetical protein